MTSQKLKNLVAKMTEHGYLTTVRAVEGGRDFSRVSRWTVAIVDLIALNRGECQGFMIRRRIALSRQSLAVVWQPLRKRLPA